jgi:AraC family transcriptional regulator
MLADTGTTMADWDPARVRPAGLPEGLAAALGWLLNGASNAAESNPHQAQGLLGSAIALLAAQQPAALMPSARGGLAPWQIRQVTQTILTRIQEVISVSDLAAVTRLSTSQFGRAFKAHFGCSPHAYVLRMRVTRALELMLRTEQPLAQIGLACGFADQAHFSRAFRGCIGITPFAWRRYHAAVACDVARPTIFGGYNQEVETAKSDRNRQSLRPRT